MKKIVAFFIYVTLYSCNFVQKEIPNQTELLNKRLQEINWNEITRYPNMGMCDTISDKNLQKTCFFECITKSIQDRLGIDTLSILYPNIDTLEVKVIVFPDSSATFEPIFTDLEGINKSKIDSILQVRLADFPKIEPAQKNGIAVKSEFIISVITKSENNL
ncbi:MAG: hypothetical protein Q4B43_07815 [Bacteroidota bacterium]|nr:hypothetical protein [Bacteroidota bacterium]